MEIEAMLRKPDKRPSGTTIYHAAALFCGREAFFNIQLNQLLEGEFCYLTVLPQRDGFEFGSLHETLEAQMALHEIASAVATVVYYLDVGHFLPQCDVLVANLDEPLDEGVVTEVCYARLTGKPVIGFRTDARSPYGDRDDQFAGMHFFPPFQCDEYIYQPLPCRGVDEAYAGMRELARRLDIAVQRRVDSGRSGGADLDTLAAVRRGASILFDGIDDVHSEAGLSEVAKRYLQNIEEFRKLGPRISKS
jgi:hypothetical protein